MVVVVVGVVVVATVVVVVVAVVVVVMLVFVMLVVFWGGGGSDSDGSGGRRRLLLFLGLRILLRSPVLLALPWVLACFLVLVFSSVLYRSCCVRLHFLHDRRRITERTPVSFGIN